MEYSILVPHEANDDRRQVLLPSGLREMGKRTTWAVLGIVLIFVGSCKQKPELKPLPPRRIVLIVANAEDFYDAALIAAARQAVSEEFNTVVNVIEAHGPEGRKAPSIQSSFTLAGVLVACKPTKRLNHQIDQAAKLGAPIYVIGHLFPSSKIPGANWKPDLSVVNEVELAGSDGVKILLRKLETENLLDRNSEVAILYDSENDPATTLRKQGFESGLLITPISMTALSWEIAASRAEAGAQIEKLVRDHPNLRMVLCTNGELLLGAVEAMDAVRPAVRPAIGGFDATPETRAALRDRKIQFLVDTQPGKLARRATIFALHHRRPEGYIRINAEVVIPCHVLTGESPAPPASGPASTLPTKQAEPR